MRLTEEQLRFFDTFGFLMFPGLFGGDVDKITETFELTWEMHGGGHAGRAHDNEHRSALIHFIDRAEYLSSLIDDPRIKGVVASLLGDDFNYTGSDGNYYVGDTAWHSDGHRDRKYMSVKMVFYLDPVARETGCLRVIPGSHKFGDKFANSLHEAAVNSSSNRIEELWGIHGRDVPAAALETEPGDLLMFNYNTKHASFGGGTRRRMFTINFSEHYADEDLPELRQEIGISSKFWVDRAYGEVMIRTASPSRMVHLEQRMANDGHLSELSRKAREDMDEPSRE